MKILHITTELTGGAGLGALRLHRDLLDSGIDSTILALSGESNDPRIVSLLNPGQHRKRRWRDIPSFALHRIGMHDSPYYRAQKSLTPFRKLTEAYVSTPFTRFDLLRHPLVQATDIVHLHWVANFLDWPSFFPKIRKPIVWTLRDENPALGFWHFRSDMPDPLPDSIRREDDWLRRMKERIVGNCRSLGIVSLSSAEDAFFADSNAFFGRPHAVVPNSIDASRFLPEAKQTIRKEIGLGDNGIILAFVAHNIGERRKGLGDLFEAVALTGRKNITIQAQENRHRSQKAYALFQLGLLMMPRDWPAFCPQPISLSLPPMRKHLERQRRKPWRVESQ